MNKRVTFFVVMMFTSVLFFSLNTQAEANSNLEAVKLMIDGSYQEPEVPARISNGRTFVPIRFIAENIGAIVQWDSKTSGITIIKGGTKLDLQLGSKEIKANGTIHAMDIAPYVDNSRTLVPVRFVSEYLGFKVGWEPSENLVIISHPIQLTINGQALTKPFEPIKVHNNIYFPIFELAKHLNVQIVDQKDLDRYSFVYQVQSPIQPAFDSEGSKTQAIDEQEETNKLGDSKLELEEKVAVKAEKQSKEPIDEQTEVDGSQESAESEEGTESVKQTETTQSSNEMITNELPSSEILEIDGVKMVAFKWVDVLLGTTSTWNSTYSAVEINKTTNVNVLNQLLFKDGVFTLDLTGLNGAGFEHFFLSSPHRLVIDLPQTILGEELQPNEGSEKVIPLQYGTIDRVRIGQFSLSPQTVRVVFDLNHRSGVQFEKVNHQLHLTIKKENALVVIDPGHGDNDPGAIGNYSMEKDIVLSVSLKIAKLLEQDPDIDVITTRADDTFLPLDVRVEIANEARADLFLSVHANASGRSTVGGTETFIFYNADKRFGSIVHKHLIKATKLTDRGLKEAGFRVIKGTSMPAALIEMAFLSNSNEEKLLNDPAFQDKVALAMYNAIREYEFGK
jgi:N-acetylmuramoyl-L-alanine amidase